MNPYGPDLNTKLTIDIPALIDPPSQLPSIIMSKKVNS